MKYNDFHYGMVLLDMLYGITIPEDTYEEIALVGWDLIGNKRSKLYRYSSDGKDGYIDLPCNCSEIEAITTDFEEWNHSTNDTPDGDINSAFTEAYIESRKAFKNPLYTSGKFIKYERVGDRLYFDNPYSRVNVLYKGVVLDENGLPQLTDKEARALSTYVAYVQKYKEGLQTNNSGLISVANDLYQRWLIQCDQARADHYFSQNELDEILDAMTNWDRKSFGRSLKIVK